MDNTNRRGFLGKMLVAIGGAAAISMGLPVLKVEANVLHLDTLEKIKRIKCDKCVDSNAHTHGYTCAEHELDNLPQSVQGYKRFEISESQSLTINQLPLHSPSCPPRHPNCRNIAVYPSHIGSRSFAMSRDIFRKLWKT